MPLLICIKFKDKFIEINEAKRKSVFNKTSLLLIPKINFSPVTDKNIGIKYEENPRNTKNILDVCAPKRPPQFLIISYSPVTP